MKIIPAYISVVALFLFIAPSATIAIVGLFLLLLLTPTIIVGVIRS